DDGQPLLAAWLRMVPRAPGGSSLAGLPLRASDRSPGAKGSLLESETDAMPTAATAPMPTRVPAPWPYPFWIAHRGAGRAAPETPPAAFRGGFAAGFRMFEGAVKPSAAGLPFLLHDAALERPTSGHGRAGAQPWAALSQLDAGGWPSAPFAGEP